MRGSPGLATTLEDLLGRATSTVAPAIAVSVRHEGAVVYEASFGLLDPEAGDGGLPLGARFDLASVTKTFTASAFLGLVSRGRVGLDDAVATVIPELAAGGARAVDGGQEPLSRRLLPAPPERTGWRVDPGAVTFRHLLAHAAGLAPWRAVFSVTGPVPPPPGQPDPVSPDVRLRAGLAAVCSYPFVDEPGRAIHYSDLGYVLLGEAVSRLVGAPLDAVVAERVTAALDLPSVGFAPGRDAAARAAAPVVATSVDAPWRGRRCRGEVEDENAAGMGGVCGHAGLFGAVEDVARFGEAWLTHDPRLGIVAKLMAEAVCEQASDAAQRRGLGWQLHPHGRTADERAWLAPLGPEAYGHTGFTGASLAIDPARRLVVALLTNRVYAARTHPGIEGLRARVHSAIAAALPVNG